jgi:hypothetical protein
MRNTIIGLAAAGCAILGLAGCGFGPPAPGSADWTKACTAMGNMGGTEDTGTVNPVGAAIAAMYEKAWSDGSATFSATGYDALATDAQRVAAAMAADDQQGALSANTQFNVDKASSNLSVC